MRQPELTTDRLLLRNFNLEDVQETQVLAGDYNVSKTTLNIPFPYLAGMAEEWINTLAKIWETKTGATYAITLNENDQLVGAIGLANIDESQAELGYWIGEQYWRKGNCSEAAKAVINFSFEHLGMNSIVAEHLISNPASGKVMEKAGMHHVETTQKFDRNKKLADMDIYAIRNT